MSKDNVLVRVKSKDGQPCGTCHSTTLVVEILDNSNIAPGIEDMAAVGDIGVYCTSCDDQWRSAR